MPAVGTMVRDALRSEYLADLRGSIIGADLANVKVRARLASLRSLLANDPDCLEWLQSGILGQGGLFKTYYNSLLGIGPNGTSVPALAGAADLGLRGPNAATAYIGTGYQITINTQGAFFSAGVGVGYGDQYADDMASLKGGTPTAQGFILLHELAHFFQAPGFALDATASGEPIDSAQRSNNDEVWRHCADTIAAAGGRT